MLSQKSEVEEERGVRLQKISAKKAEFRGIPAKLGGCCRCDWATHRQYSSSHICLLGELGQNGDDGILEVLYGVNKVGRWRLPTTENQIHMFLNLISSPLSLASPLFPIHHLDPISGDRRYFIKEY